MGEHVLIGFFFIFFIQCFIGFPLQLALDHLPPCIGHTLFIAQKQCGRGQYRFLHLIGGALSQGIEQADDVHFVIEKFDAHRLFQILRVHVHYIAAEGALTLAFHHGQAHIAHFRQVADQIVRRIHVAGPDGHRFCPPVAAGHNGLHQCIHRHAQNIHLALRHAGEHVQLAAHAFLTADGAGKEHVPCTQRCAHAPPAQIHVYIPGGAGSGAFRCRDIQNRPPRQFVHGGRQHHALGRTDVVDGMYAAVSARQHACQRRVLFQLLKQYA